MPRAVFAIAILFVGLCIPVHAAPFRAFKYNVNNRGGDPFLMAARRRSLLAYSCATCTGTAATTTSPRYISGAPLYSLSNACTIPTGRCLEPQSAFAKGESVRLGCTANDVRLASVFSESNSATCLRVPGQTVTIPLIAQIDVTSATRYDIAIYVGVNGTAKSGSSCFNFQLPKTVIPAQPDLAKDTPTPDCCGDWVQTPDLFLKIDFVIPCDGDVGGNLTLDYCASWKNQANPGCPGFDGVSGNLELLSADSSPKCKCDKVVTNVIVIQPVSTSISFVCTNCASQAVTAAPAVTCTSTAGVTPAIVGTPTSSSVTISAMDPRATYTCTITPPATGYFDLASGRTTSAVTVTIVNGTITSPAGVTSLPLCPRARPAPGISVSCTPGTNYSTLPDEAVLGGTFNSTSCALVPSGTCPTAIAGGPSGIGGSTFTGTASYTYSIASTPFFFGAAGTPLTKTRTITFTVDKCTGNVEASPSSLSAVKPYTIAGSFLADTRRCGGVCGIPIQGVTVTLTGGANATTSATGDYSFSTPLDPRVTSNVSYAGFVIFSSTDALVNDCTGTVQSCLTASCP